MTFSANQGGDSMATKINFVGAALICATIALPGGALAQQKQQASYKLPAADSTIEHQLNVEVGDQANHIIRIYETRSLFPREQPVVGGMKMVEQWAHGTVDMIDGNGTGMQYIVVVMDNGDKFFARGGNVLQTISGKLTVIGIATITGGTGKLTGIQGFVRQTTALDLKSSAVDSQYDVEYALAK